VLAKMFLYGRACVHNTVAHPSRRQLYLNRVLLTGLATASLALPGRRRWLLPAMAVTSALWVADTLEVLRVRRSRDVMRASIAVSIKWAFHAGILAEGLRRVRPDVTYRTFRYVDDEHFRPRSHHRARLRRNAAKGG
jgi:hypothetical protein